MNWRAYSLINKVNMLAQACEKLLTVLSKQGQYPGIAIAVGVTHTSYTHERAL